MESDHAQRRSNPAGLGRAVGDLLGALATFTDAEARLAEAEAGKSLEATRQGLGLMAMGLGTGFLGATWLLGVGVSLLSNSLPAWLAQGGVRRHLSAGLIGLALVTGGAKLTLAGKDRLTTKPFQKTRENLDKLKEAVAED